ncbi:S1 RNA-binding domain-containing protein [Candidatus Vidania fulgoroideorum]
MHKLFKILNCKKGDILVSKILKVKKKNICINSKLKSLSIIKKNKHYKVNKTIITEIIKTGLSFGETILSISNFEKKLIIKNIEKRYKKNLYLKGLIFKIIKGGMSVLINNVICFLPGSLLDVRKVNNLFLLNKVFKFKIIKMEKNNIVLSRKKYLLEEKYKDFLILEKKIRIGDILVGKVRYITKYGAFIKIKNNIDGLLHISNISDFRIGHPSEYLKTGEYLRVVILKINLNNKKILLGRKQLFLKKKKVKILKIFKNSILVKIEKKSYGIINSNEISWIGNINNINKVFKKNCFVYSKIIFESKKQIRLSIKRCLKNPWSNLNLKQVGKVLFKQGKKYIVKFYNKTFGFLKIKKKLKKKIYLFKISDNKFIY